MFLKPSVRPLIIFIMATFVCAIYGQSLSETWNVHVYQSSDYAQFYGNVYFSNSMEEWDSRVEEVLYYSIGQWQDNADRMVEQILSEETGQDAFVSNDGYLDERRRSLLSEVSLLYSDWERDLIEDYFENRHAFLEKLETGKVDALYFHRIGQESLYDEYTIEELNLTENRNKILESAREWEFQWGKTRQEGLDSFANSIAKLENDYQLYIRSLEETEKQFSENLNAINSYKNTIKLALFEVVSQLKSSLDSSCSVSSGCQYKNFDGSHNEAGKLFSKFISDLSDQLHQSEVDPDSLLTAVSTKIRDFLSDESNKAFSEYTLYNNQVYTYQTGFQINLDQTKVAFDLSNAQWNLRNQTYHELSADSKYENWLAGGFGEVGTFSNVYDLEMQGIFQSIHHGDYTRLISIINNRLGNGRHVQSLISANVYTDAFHFINNTKIGDFYIPFNEAFHTNGNLIIDGKAKYGYWTADRQASIFSSGRFDFQMGAVGYSILYEMYDENSSQTSLYWKDNYTQLGGQSGHFRNTLLPAVSHWESKVKDYSSAYDQWKENKEDLIAEAKEKLKLNQLHMEDSKSAWLQRLEEEKRTGWKSWSDLYESGEVNKTNIPLVSAWMPNKQSEIFGNSEITELQSKAVFYGPTDGIQINGTSLYQELQRTIVGVGQYVAVIQVNSDLAELQRSEQKKLTNQMTYGINWESLNGRDLTKEEKILLGSYDTSLLSHEEQTRFGSCYENPNADICKTLLKKEYETTFDSKNGVLTLEKEIHNGLIAGKNLDGHYDPGKTKEVRHIQLSSVEKVQGPIGKGFFTEWSVEDWDRLHHKKMDVTQTFLTTSLQKDKQFITSNMNSIEEKNNRNRELFLTRKESQENAESLVQELAVAYFSGGAAGMRASLKGKLESTINNELAKAWITATGGSESDIQVASMVIDFMRGRMNAKKIRAREQHITIKDPIQALEKIVAKTLSTTLKVADEVTLGHSTVALNLIQAPIMAIAKLAVGERQYNKLNDQIAGPGKRMEEIRSNEQSLVQNGVSIAVSQGTGLPTEAISKMLGDKYGQLKAKKANKAMAKNPIYDMGSQIVGAFGGIVKTAIVAFGMPEDEIQSIMQDTNGIINAGNINQNSSTNASFGYTLQAMGMQASWTKHQSAYLNLRDSKAVVEELGKKALAKEIAKSMGMEENAISQIVDSTYSSYQKQKSDKKARSSAVRQTVVNAAALAITLGASGALSGVGSALSKIGKVVSSMTNGFLPATTQVGQAVASTFVQTIAGSHEGPKGAMAGFANGVLGGITQGMGKIQSGYLKGMIPGIGVSYSEKYGWGGSVGIGNAISNMSVSFSEQGNTSLQASKSLGGGVQIATDMTTNGALNVGLNYNPTGEGPRKDWNFSMMYDLKGGGFSGSIGYTDPMSKLGLTSSIGKDGISTSSELQGVTLGTNSENGFEMQEMNFAEQNINAAQDESDLSDGETIANSGNDSDSFSDFADAAGTMGALLLGGVGLGFGLRNRWKEGLTGITSIGSDVKTFDIQSTSEKSILGAITNSLKSGLLRMGESVSSFADGFTIEKNSEHNKKSKVDSKQKISSEEIKKIESSVIDDFNKDSRLDTEKKLYELRKAGVDTTEIEAKIKKLQGGKDAPIPKLVEKELNEYIRLREGNSPYTLSPENTIYISSAIALAGININHDPKKESNAAYLKRLGDEICEASKNVDLSTKELVTEHVVNVAKLLGESLKGKISYQQYKIIDGKEVVSAVNPVDANGFRSVDGLDCIRFIGAVLNASGITAAGSFANLNTDVYQMPNEMKNMGSEYANRTAHKNGVEYFRQSSNFMNLVSDRITTSKDLADHKANFKPKELNIGLIGITRADKSLPNSISSAVKSDHVYMIIDKRFNKELGIFEYQIAESRDGKGVDNRWIRSETNEVLREVLMKKLNTMALSKKAINDKVQKFNKILMLTEESSYLGRSEFYELKPQVRAEVVNET